MCLKLLICILILKSNRISQNCWGSMCSEFEGTPKMSCVKLELLLVLPEISQGFLVVTGPG